jgi:hypothetical protein
MERIINQWALRAFTKNHNHISEIKFLLFFLKKVLICGSYLNINTHEEIWKFCRLEKRYEYTMDALFTTIDRHIY